MNALTETLSEVAEWDAAGLAALGERAGVATLIFCDLTPEDYEISILGCDDAKIAQLNADELLPADAPVVGELQNQQMLS